MAKHEPPGAAAMFRAGIAFAFVITTPRHITVYELISPTSVFQAGGRDERNPRSAPLFSFRDMTVNARHRKVGLGAAASWRVQR